MKLSVNLLPQNYVRAQLRRRRIRLGVMCGAILLGLELLAGISLHLRAGRTRELRATTQATQATIQAIQRKMDAPRAESDLLSRQLSLARRLRTTHHWSRLLALFSQAASTHVILTEMSTIPPKWSPDLSEELLVTAEKNKAEPVVLLHGLTVRGCAADYEELTQFISQLQALEAFASLNLREARRDKFLEQDVISFELQCRW